MRTKILLLIAAAAAAGITASQAQVYSVNAVGYVNKTIPAKSGNGFALISNPLNAPTNTIAALLTGQVPQDTAVYLWDATAKKFNIATYDTTFGWDPPAVANTTVTPGGGFFVKNPGTTDIKITFVGEVPTGSPLHTPLIAGLQIVSSQVPQSGTLSDLGYTGTQDDVAYQWNATTQKYDISTFDTTFGWDPALKVLDVGDAVFLSRTTAGSWDRNFQVNQ